MRNIFLFIRRYSVFLGFLILQGICIWMLFTYNRSHRAKGMGVTNEVTGWFNTRYNTVRYFFRMKEENAQVHKMNDSLMNLLSDNFSVRDTGQPVVRDTIKLDTLGHYRRFAWRSAQAVYSTVNSDKNYIQINRGSAQGIRDDMGVFSSNGGLVGKVIATSENYSQVMSLLHVQSKVNVLLKKTGTGGTISWDGEDPRFLMMSGISQSDSVMKGDTIVTGRFSFSFPPNKLVGTVDAVIKNSATNFYTLRIRPFANFATLQQVFVSENVDFNEQQKLNEDARRKVDLKKTTP